MKKLIFNLRGVSSWLLTALIGFSEIGEAGTWQSKIIPNCFSAWTIARTSRGTFVGGSSLSLSPTVWRYREGKWNQIFGNPSLVGSVNSLAADTDGSIDATLQGTTYSWRSEIQEYYPKTNSWSLLGSGNGAVYSSIQTSGDFVAVAGTVRLPIPGVWPHVGVLDIMLGKSRFSTYLDKATGFSAMVADHVAGIYVSGIYTTGTPDTPEPKAGAAGLWFYDGHNFKEINLPSSISGIDAMTSDGFGTIYIAGLDASNTGRVWVLSNGLITDTGLSARSVKSLATDGRGILYAGGIDNQLKGQVWQYTPWSGKWLSHGLKKSAFVRAVSVTGNQVYAVGADSRSKARMWIYR